LKPLGATQLGTIDWVTTMQPGGWKPVWYPPSTVCANAVIHFWKLN
jgi:hypothetical protein